MSIGKSESRIQTICLMLLCTIGVAGALYWLQGIIVPFILAIFVSLILTPVVNFQVRKLRFPRILAILGTLLLCFFIMLILGGIVSASVAQLANNANVYQNRVEILFDKAITELPLDKLGIEDPADLDIASIIPISTTRTVLVKLTGSIISILSQGLIVMMFVIFLLLGSTTPTKPKEGVVGEIDRQVKQYLVVKVLLSGVTGFAVFAILHFLGVDYAISFGAFAFFLNFIPNIGSLIATIIPLPVVLLMPDPSVGKILLALLLPGLVQFGVGNLLEPRLMGSSLGLHPVTVLLSLMFWGTLWGIIGMLLAVPMTSIMKICLDRLELTHPIAALLAGRLELSEETKAAPEKQGA